MIKASVGETGKTKGFWKLSKVYWRPLHLRLQVGKQFTLTGSREWGVDERKMHTSKIKHMPVIGQKKLTSHSCVFLWGFFPPFYAAAIVMEQAQPMTLQNIFMPRLLLGYGTQCYWICSVTSPERKSMFKIPLNLIHKSFLLVAGLSIMEET